MQATAKQPWRPPVDPPRAGARPRTPSVAPIAPAAVADGRAAWILWSLLACLLGLLGLIALLYGTKFHGVGSSIAGLPSRLLFVAAFILVFAPLLLTLFHRVPTVFLLIPIATAILLYPLFNPFGIPYSRDPIFNFQFAQFLLQSGHWTPGAGTTLQAVAYSYYPASGVFNAEFAAFTGLPLATTFLVSIPILHLLILPAAIYAIGAQLFGPRYAFGGVLFYAATASILFNIPVQQEFAVPFFLLTLLALCILSVSTLAPTSHALEIAVILFSSYVILSHHVTSYFLGAWLAGLFILPYILGGTRERAILRVGEIRGKEVYLLRERSGIPHGPLRSGHIAVRYFLVFLLFSYFVSLPVLANHLLLFGQALTNLVVGTPPSARIAATGQSFPLYQQAWIYLSIGAFLVVGLLTAWELLRQKGPRFLASNLIIGGLATIATLAFLPTTFAFLPLREMEFSAVFAAPVLGWWLSARLYPRLRSWVSRLPRPRSAWVRLRAPQVAVVALAALVAGGGLLVPVDVRDQFAPSSSILIDSPLHIDGASYDLAVWAHAHLNGSAILWGDELAYSVFGGFGRFAMRFNQYELFNGTNISNASWHILAYGNLIVTDVYMTQATPEFPGPSSSQPTGPLSEAQLLKFQDARYFDTIVDGPTFTVYEVVHKPPGV